MKKAILIAALIGLLVISCNPSRKDVRENRKAEIRKIDSLVTRIDSMKSGIDSSMKEVDELIDGL
jgi:cytochrome c556